MIVRRSLARPPTVPRWQQRQLRPLVVQLPGSPSPELVNGLYATKRGKRPRSLAFGESATVQQPQSAVDEGAKAAAGDGFLLRVCVSRRYARLRIGSVRLSGQVVLSPEKRDARALSVLVKVEAVGDGGGFHAAGDAELGQDPRDVDACGALGDEQLPADLLVGPSLGHQREHLGLAPG
jgi:hypothetical protein